MELLDRDKLGTVWKLFSIITKKKNYKAIIFITQGFREIYLNHNYTSLQYSNQLLILALSEVAMEKNISVLCIMNLLKYVKFEDDFDL